jgi:hypothetical protein
MASSRSFSFNASQLATLPPSSQVRRTIWRSRRAPSTGGFTCRRKRVIQDVFRHLAIDQARTDAIAAEVINAYDQGRKVLVLTAHRKYRCHPKSYRISARAAADMAAR